LRLLSSLIFTGLLWGSSCGPAEQKHAPALPKRPLELPDPGPNVLGLEVYKTHCKLCHGLDGQMGGSGAANLALSLLTEEESRNVIAKGRNLMTAYEKKLSPEELDAVAQYIQLFKAN